MMISLPSFHHYDDGYYSFPSAFVLHPHAQQKTTVTAFAHAVPHEKGLDLHLTRQMPMMTSWGYWDVFYVYSTS
jgi:hypothetical protein